MHIKLHVSPQQLGRLQDPQQHTASNQSAPSSCCPGLGLIAPNSGGAFRSHNHIARWPYHDQLLFDMAREHDVVAPNIVIDPQPCTAKNLTAANIFCTWPVSMLDSVASQPCTVSDLTAISSFLTWPVSMVSSPRAYRLPMSSSRASSSRKKLRYFQDTSTDRFAPARRRYCTAWPHIKPLTYELSNPPGYLACRNTLRQFHDTANARVAPARRRCLAAGPLLRIRLQLSVMPPLEKHNHRHHPPSAWACSTPASCFECTTQDIMARCETFVGFKPPPLCCTA